jgi:hypothetical protein
LEGDGKRSSAKEFSEKMVMIFIYPP